MIDMLAILLTHVKRSYYSEPKEEGGGRMMDLIFVPWRKKPNGLSTVIGRTKDTLCSALTRLLSIDKYLVQTLF